MLQRERTRRSAWHCGRTIAIGLIALLTASRSLVADEKTDNAATRDYAVAVGFQNKQLYPQAVARWRKFIDAYPNDPRRDRAHYHLGACQLKSGEAEKAAETFRLVLANYPNFASRDAAQFNFAMALYQIGIKANQPAPLKAAAEAFAQVVAGYPQSKQLPAALFYQGESLYAAGDPRQAVALYEQLLAHHANSDVAADARYALGTAQQELGESDAAEKTLRAFLAAHAQDPRANECKLRLGLSQMAAKKYGEAGQTLGQVAAIADFPLADLALLRQAECHAR
jgi:TolA-binding protein